MRKLVTYNKSQYKALIDQLGDGGFKLMSLLELHGSDQISELLSEKKLVVDVSSLVGLLSGDLQLASKFELLVHQLPFGTLFIGDDKTVNEGAYQLRTMFDDIIECDIEIDKDAQKDKRVKRTLVSLDELEFKQVLTTLESELIGQIGIQTLLRIPIAQLQALQRARRAAGILVAPSWPFGCRENRSRQDSLRGNRAMPAPP